MFCLRDCNSNRLPQPKEKGDGLVPATLCLLIVDALLQVALTVSPLQTLTLSNCCVTSSENWILMS